MKKYFIYSLILLLTVSCELTDAIDQDPPDNLVPGNVIKNEEDAQALLNGVYGQIVSYTTAHYYMYSETIPSAMIGTMSSAGGGSANSEFAENDLSIDNSNVNSFWKIIYSVVDAANNSIALTAELPASEISETTRNEIIGEAHFLRAMGTFDLLRYFGQFYDASSSLGIILRTEPVNFISRDKARNTVAESYSQILSDLDFAIANAPDFNVNYRASKVAALALKARVLLYKGDYAEAASIADQVINSGSRNLEGTFEDTFDKGLSSSEIILQTYRDENSDSDQNNRKRFYLGRAGTTWFANLMNEDPRQAFTYSGTTVLKVNNSTTYRPTYFIRLAEMYLIKSEALARSGATLEESKAPLDVIRMRAGLEMSAAESLPELMDDIFEEYIKELAFENGSDWFAAIRFDKAMELKSTITSVNQYILPIPLTEIEGNQLLGPGDQNPGYNF
ncbi:RagB/SusD family nutrient uptake outer membrane protein [Gillisia sp. M10.2A]|uniref:RagB/SusD family nutrient uptake outer membrane protein n=1 Tax=Gillisia lutea TaxID=2909668 RepID=A0ABS9EH86_9FLAO|nr:RagB/SusD family nutrient uptake outer membrane protein [Gillisia lutea]MCF4102216.1 RagB/SusD family nutrient uptake outer membrane protein [Gillisia lutea]